MMKFRPIALVSAAALAIVGQALVGSAQQAPAGAAAASTPLDSLHFRPIGPASMSGRVSDIAVYEANPAIYYVATAHGGVWKTINNGTTFTPQLQNQGLLSFGDVAISQSNPDLVWAGGGESNNRQSTSWGDGIYKSTDGGKTYANMGLRDSKHINRVVIDPRDNNVVFAAVTGSLWGPGGERGVYRTADAGRTWKLVLKVDENTGANDLVMDPTDNRVLYASMYQRRRTACCFNGGGTGSGIWKSTDGGETWTRLTGGVLDLPLGRIAVNVYRKNPNVLYALIEGPTAPTVAGRQGGGRQGGAPAAPPAAVPGQNVAPGVNPGPTGLYRSNDAGASWTKVNNNNPRPMYFSQITIDPNDPETVYLGGVGLHQTFDGGKSMLTDVAASTHDDVHAIWVNPANSDHVLIGNDGGMAVSYDKAKSWNFLPNLPVGLFYHVSVDMAIPYNVCGGMQDNYNWCGPSAVRGAAGIANHHWATLQGGDGFVVLQDPTDYRVAYSESQDGNIVRVDRVTGETISIRPQPAAGEAAFRWHWDTPMLLSPHDPRTIYSAANKVFRSTDRGLSWIAISSDLTESPSRDDIVTMGTKGSEIQFSRNDGISQWPAIVSLAESSKRAGLIYAGTDDGNVAVTRDGGKRWDNVTDKIQGIPKGVFVSELVPSRFNEGVVYATFDAHRENDFKTYIYASSDYGASWQRISSNLTDEVARTLTEDTRNPDVLYLGTESGLFVSLNRGKHWQRIKANLPTVRIDEITIHPRDNAMILATHGRTLWILDHLEPIQEFAAAQAASADADLFTPPAFAWYQRPARDRNYEFWGDQVFYGQNPPPAARLSWFLKKPASSLSLRITDAGGREVREISGPVLNAANNAGVNMACWDLRVQPAPATAFGAPQGGRQGGAPPAQASTPPVNPFGAGCPGGGGFGGGGNAGPFVLPGTYNVSLIVDGKTVETKPLKVIGDAEVGLTDAERKTLFDRAMELHDLQRRATDVLNRLAPINRQGPDIAKEVASRADIPADVKAQVDAFSKELAAVAPKFIAQPGQGGGFPGGGAPSPNIMLRIGQSKNGLMGGMMPTEATMKGYADLKTAGPQAIAEANAVIAKAQALSTVLAKYNIKLDVPK
ncbi:MAG: hypothetical protein M3R55_11180 [Acidobacteriota bacterium]|nr:hypothetical protein [Acidobacteriota bacterium]